MTTAGTGELDSEGFSVPDTESQSGGLARGQKSDSLRPGVIGGTSEWLRMKNQHQAFYPLHKSQ